VMCLEEQLHRHLRLRADRRCGGGVPRRGDVGPNHQAVM